MTYSFGCFCNWEISIGNAKCQTKHGKYIGQENKFNVNIFLEILSTQSDICSRPLYKIGISYHNLHLKYYLFDLQNDYTLVTP